MIYLGSYKASDTVFYAANFHNDTGTIEDPTSPEAQIRNSAGTWSALTAPAKQNTKTGHYGGTVDTTGFAVGQHIIRMAGTVATAKTVATEFCFTIVANIESDTYAIVNSGTYGNAQLVRSTTPANTLDVSTTGEAGLDFNNIKDAGGAHTLTNITVPVATTLTNAPSDSSGITTLLTRIASALTITTGKVDVNDKTGFSISGTKTTLDALNDIPASAILTTALTESYAADGATPTLAQFLYQIWSSIGDFSISGTTITCKKLDGATTSMTFTLDSGTDPTSRTRVT